MDGRAKWPEAFEWMLSWAEKFKSVFAQRVKDIVLPEPAPVTDEEARAAATEPIASAEPAQPEIPS